MRTLIAGHITHDFYEADTVAGGCAYYGALTHRAFGNDIVLCTVVGDDFQCAAQLNGIHSQLVHNGQTTSFVNCYPANAPRIQLVSAQAPEVHPKLFRNNFSNSTFDIVHLAPVLGEIDLAAWKAVFKPRVLALNVQGWIKVAGPAVSPQILQTCQLTGNKYRHSKQVVQSPWAITTEDLRGVDVACLSHEDLIGQGDLLDRLREAIPIVALTYGDDGCEVFERGKSTRIGIFPTQAVDPTGAGDVFAAAFVQRLARGDCATEAARYGAAAASIIVEGRGPEMADRLMHASDRVNKVV